MVSWLGANRPEHEADHSPLPLSSTKVRYYWNLTCTRATCLHGVNYICSQNTLNNTIAGDDEIWLTLEATVNFDSKWGWRPLQLLSWHWCPEMRPPQMDAQEQLRTEGFAVLLLWCPCPFSQELEMHGSHSQWPSPLDLLGSVVWPSSFPSLSVAEAS